MENDDIKALATEICFTIEDAYEGRKKWRRKNGFAKTWVLVSRDLATILAFPIDAIGRTEVESSGDVFHYSICATYDEIDTFAADCIAAAERENK